MSIERKSHWCLETILHTTLSEETISKRFHALYTYAKQHRVCETKSPYACAEWTADLVRKIDELWYNKRLIPDVVKQFGGIYVCADRDCGNMTVAAFINEKVPFFGKAKLELHINYAVFDSIFKKREHGYHSGGLLCRDTLTCFLHVLLHETLHIVTTVCHYAVDYDDSEEHSEEFEKALLNLFGQTDAKHGMLIGYEQFHSLHELRNSLSVGSPVEVFLGTTPSKKKWYPGKIVKINDKCVHVLHDGTVYKMHVGLIRHVRGKDCVHCTNANDSHP